MLRSLFCANKLCGRTQILTSLSLSRKPKPNILRQAIRKGHMIPANQYDQFQPWPPHMFRPGIMVEKYELIPIVIITGYVVCMVLCYCVYMTQNKEAVMWKPSQTVRTEISRTMDLRRPTIHKLKVVTPSCYDPWPEMQDVLDAMKRAERQEAERNAIC